MGRDSGICRDPIAGCNIEYKNLCYETIADHVGRMLEKYRELRGSLRAAISDAYRGYIEELEELGDEFRQVKDSPMTRILLGCDLVELAIAFHDVGKCTLENQKSLRDRCTAPLHEVVSAAYLYSVAISLDRRYGILISTPLILGILLHHHALRSLQDVVREIGKVKIANEDCTCVPVCASIGLSMACPELDKADKSIRVRCFNEYLQEVGQAITIILDPRMRRVLKRVPEMAYGVAVTLSGILSLLDRYSAGVNRSCGRMSERDLDRDVREFLERRALMIDAGRAVREMLGVYHA